MVTATVLSALTWLAQLDGYKYDEVRALALARSTVASSRTRVPLAEIGVSPRRAMCSECAPPRSRTCC